MLESLFSRFRRIVLLDTETTGIDPKQDEIIELAAISVEKNESDPPSIERMDEFIRLSPGRTLSPEIIKLTGITDELLEAEGREKHDAAERFCGLISEPDTLVIAYNAQFDLNFLFFFLKKEGMADALKGIGMLDALTVYKDRRPYPHKLCNAIEQYCLETQNTHRAIDDVQATLELMCAMEDECDDLAQYINLFGYSPKYGISGSRISSVRYEPQPYNAAKKLYQTGFIK